MIEKIQKRVLRIMLGSMYDSYESAILLTGLQKLDQRRQHLLVSFGKRILTSEMFRSMLPSYRDHGRALRRSTLMLQVPRCRTQRLKLSAVPAMVDALNNE